MEKQSNSNVVSQRQHHHITLIQDSLCVDMFTHAGQLLW